MALAATLMPPNVEWPARPSKSGRSAEFSWVCAGCRQEREPGSLYVLGPDIDSHYGPLLWDADCLRFYYWRFPKRT